MEFAQLDHVRHPSSRADFFAGDSTTSATWSGTVSFITLHPSIMLSRAILPLTRPNILASTVRVGSLSTQRPRWYAKGKPYKLPENLQSKTGKEPKQSQHASEQPEFDTKAQPETEAPESTVRHICHLV